MGTNTRSDSADLQMPQRRKAKWMEHQRTPHRYGLTTFSRLAASEAIGTRENAELTTNSVFLD